MLAGLKGSGKTTTAAKLALHLRKQNERVALIAADPYRVAGEAQLASLGKQLDLPVYGMEGEKQPAVAAKRAIAEAAKAGMTAVIVDTAGRSHGDPEMMAEIVAIRDAVQPQEVLLVLDAMTGQEAVNAATEFNEALALSGFILTKMDGDARGGAALSIRSVTGLPVKFVGAGEKVDALEAFHPDRFASRILGMGDVVSLVEKAQQSIGEEEMQRLEQRVRSQKFDMQDFLDQYQNLKKMGSMSSLLGMLPGMSALKGKIDVDNIDDAFFKRSEAIMLSMTQEERQSPQIINGSRRRRIAEGSDHRSRGARRDSNACRRKRVLLTHRARVTGPLAPFAPSPSRLLTSSLHLSRPHALTASRPHALTPSRPHALTPSPLTCTSLRRSRSSPPSWLCCPPLMTALSVTRTCGQQPPPRRAFVRRSSRPSWGA